MASPCPLCPGSCVSSVRWAQREGAGAGREPRGKVEGWAGRGAGGPRGCVSGACGSAGTTSAAQGPEGRVSTGESGGHRAQAGADVRSWPWGRVLPMCTCRGRPRAHCPPRTQTGLGLVLHRGLGGPQLRRWWHGLTTKDRWLLSALAGSQRRYSWSWQACSLCWLWAAPGTASFSISHLVPDARHPPSTEQHAVCWPQGRTEAQTRARWCEDQTQEWPLRSRCHLAGP